MPLLRTQAVPSHIPTCARSGKPVAASSRPVKDCQSVSRLSLLSTRVQARDSHTFMMIFIIFMCFTGAHASRSESMGAERAWLPPGAAQRPGMLPGCLQVMPRACAAFQHAPQRTTSPAYACESPAHVDPPHKPSWDESACVTRARQRGSDCQFQEFFRISATGLSVPGIFRISAEGL